ncbi:hypothetical protein QTP86_026471, partial [Hemibagrus guttatus]
ATGVFKVAVCQSFPVEDITLIWGNDIAGVFAACVVTRAKARLLEDVVDLFDSFLKENAAESVMLSPFFACSSVPVAPGQNSKKGAIN